MLCNRDASGLIIVDLQDSFLAPIGARDAVLHRSKFLIEVANLLQVPILATEQYATRMGSTTQSIQEKLGSAPKMDKLCFSGCRNEEFWSAWEALGRNQVVIIGIETHICVTQTALDFLVRGYDVFVCEDATNARLGAHEGALKRLRHEGVAVTHTESVAYEWLGEAGTPEFKLALEIVKRYA
ncbi:MAG: isochorismatase family protein [Fimbriimonadales bacterium]